MSPITTTIHNKTPMTPVCFVQQQHISIEAKTVRKMPQAVIPQQPHASSQHISHASAHSSQQSPISSFVTLARDFDRA
jgi:hypothetical protein